MDRKNAWASFVAPEEIKLKTKYALTINPSDRFQYFTNKKNRVDFFIECIRRFLKDHLETKYWFCVEISNTGRLHLHGTVTFLTHKQQLNFYLFLGLLKFKGIATYKFGDINDELFADKHSESEDDVDGQTYKTWKEYCTKQQDFWKNCGIDGTMFTSAEQLGNHGTRYDDISKNFL